MSLLDKLIGNSKKAVNNVIGSITNALNEKGKAEQEAPKPQHSGIQVGATIPHYEPEPAPSGVSWGPTMPAEPNQYNYPGTWLQYFDVLFMKEFSEYRIVRDVIGDGKRVVYTFYSGEKTALVVEVMNQSCAAQKLRRDCRRSGTPYLRYYYDHEGWWNTYSYVCDRSRAALG